MHYPSALDELNAYVRQSVLIEFGGRNITEPSESHQVQPDIAPHLEALDFPEPVVNVLSPSRTFWEKATLMHVECQRANFRASAERLSRHWYDLSMLAGHPAGARARQNRALLADVVRHKKIFHNASYAHYDACLHGQMHLVPESVTLTALQDDYQRMQDAGMFMQAPPTFSERIERLRALESAINREAPPSD